MVLSLDNTLKSPGSLKKIYPCNGIPGFCIVIFFLMFIIEKAQVGEGQRDRETQNPKQDPGSELSAQNLMWDSNPQTVIS